LSHFTPAPGAPSAQFPSSLITSPPVFRPRSGMSLKHIVPYQSIQNSGPALLSSYADKIPTASTLMTILVWHQLVKFMAKWLMLVLTFSEHKVLALFQNGWMITSSFGYLVSTSVLTTQNEACGMRRLLRMEGSHSPAVTCGTMEKSCLMTSLLNLMKTHLAPLEIMLSTLFTLLLMMLLLLTVMLILTTFQYNFVSPGNHPKQFHSQTKFLFWVFIGIYLIEQLKLQKRRKKNTRRLLGFGLLILLIPWTTSRNFMENCYMPASWCQQNMLILPALRPCWAHKP
jgi:hypothetical protein